jgi:hypothetical protein
MSHQQQKSVIIKTFWNAAKKGTKPEDKVPSGWVAELPGFELNDKGYPRLARKFLRESSLEWLGKKSEKWPRGIKTYILPDGLYEVQSFKSEQHAVQAGEEGGDRYFCQVKNGVLKKLSREELELLLPAAPAQDEPETNDEPPFIDGGIDDE